MSEHRWSPWDAGWAWVGVIVGVLTLALVWVTFLQVVDIDPGDCPSTPTEERSKT